MAGLLEGAASTWTTRHDQWRLDPRYRELEQALENGNIVAHYQPIVDANTQDVIAMEALARWQHPARGLVPPANFIQFAETCGLIAQIGDTILQQACSQAVEWHDVGHHIDMYVNVSLRQLEDSQFPSRVQSILLSTRLDPAHLKFELTEGLASAQSKTLQQTLRELKGIGVELVLDDFGTEYATLQCMLEFPISTVKLDQMFIRGVDKDKRKAEMVKSVLSMSRRLGLDLIAEGVETEDEAAFLRKYKCSKLQGFLYGRPGSGQSAGHRLSNGLATQARTASLDEASTVASGVPKSLVNRLRDYEWLERCTTPMMNADDVFTVMASVRDLFMERFPLDRFGILVGTMNDRYCVIHELVTRDDMEACPPGSLMIVRGTGLERVYLTGHLHYNPDMATNPEFVEDPELSDTGLRSMARIPLTAKGQVFGVMTVKCCAVDAYSPADLDLMSMAAKRLAASLFNVKLIYSLKEAAYKDTLTDTFNRRFLTEAVSDPNASILESLAGLEAHAATPVSVLFVDIDHFKEFNDTYGHTAGDEQLKAVARRLTTLVGDDGFVVRYGGDEFLVIVPNPTLGSAEDAVMQLRAHAARLRNNGMREQAFCVGMAEGVWADLEHIVSRADTHMYEDKAARV